MHKIEFGVQLEQGNVVLRLNGEPIVFPAMLGAEVGLNLFKVSLQTLAAKVAPDELAYIASMIWTTDEMTRLLKAEVAE